MKARERKGAQPLLTTRHGCMGIATEGADAKAGANAPANSAKMRLPGDQEEFEYEFYVPY